MKLRWGILGPGSIAKTFADALAHSKQGELVAIGTRSPGKPRLSDRFPGARIHSGYAALLADPAVDAVYIATPHPGHPEWAIKAAEAGKHVLVEKPIALTAHEADAMFHAATLAGTFLGEAFMYRSHPQTKALVDLVSGGAIGEIRLVKSSFGFAMPADMWDHRLYANDLAGGGILDVGCYPVSMARLLAGASVGQPFLNPVEVSGVAHLGQTGVDEWASAVLKFETGLLAEVSCSVSVQQDNVLRIFGTTGRIEVADFWFASGHAGGVGTISVIGTDGARRDIEVVEPGWLYAFEADAVAEAIWSGRQEFSAPGMTRADSLGNMRVLDRWRHTAGLIYGIETAQRRTMTVRGEPLGSLGDRIPRRSVVGLVPEASVVALGFMGFTSFTAASILLDRFWETGGNLFDTAWVYDDGAIEKVLGDWLQNRGIREQAVVLGKGAHTPFCRPEMIGRQLTESLDRLQTDYVDIYLMHRDDPAIPVEEFVDAMDAEVRAGRIRGPFGGSNWTMERMDAAIAYAERAGKQAPQVLSNNVSLAEMIQPVWPGCVSSSSARWAQWLTGNQISNFAWSSQSRGFFTDRAGRTKLEDVELVTSWYSESNFARRDRAIELARQLGASPIHVALAYVLGQPYTSVPIIGPASVGELDDSLRALDVHLAVDQLRWLEGTHTP
jgi:predicted dehydrogenase/aryl-alcohol dehydrogenase-like predicted oxidoreductase